MTRFVRFASRWEGEPPLYVNPDHVRVLYTGVVDGDGPAVTEVEISDETSLYVRGSLDEVANRLAGTDQL